MLKQLSALVVFLVLLLLTYALFTPTANDGELTSTQAIDLVLQDLKYLEDQGNELKVEQVTQSEKYGWEITMRITDAPHSFCPTVIKRFYTLSPFGFRPEDVIINCNEKHPILYREEALINSGLLSEVRALPNARGCAFYVGENAVDLKSSKQYCPWIQVDELTNFVQGVPPESWVVHWSNNEKFVLIAFDADTGKLIS